MKKSEAINRLRKFLKDNHIKYASNDDAKSVLDFMLDELKMTPPERVRYTDLPNGNTLCSPECSWEDEDET